MSRAKNNSRKKLYVLSLLAIVVIGLVIGAVLLKLHKNSSVIPSVVVKTTSSETKGSNNSSGSKTQSTQTTTANNNGGNGKTTVGNSNTTKSNSTNPPDVPTGTFVSNHQPGVGSPTQEESVCNTSVGATCYIQFTMNGTVKTLTTQTVGNTGSVYWNWDAATASSGLTPGSWTVSAVATQNGQTRTATDSIPLEISNQ